MASSLKLVEAVLKNASRLKKKANNTVKSKNVQQFLKL